MRRTALATGVRQDVAVVPTSVTTRRRISSENRRRAMVFATYASRGVPAKVSLCPLRRQYNTRLPKMRSSAASRRTGTGWRCLHDGDGVFPDVEVVVTVVPPNPTVGVISGAATDSTFQNLRTGPTCAPQSIFTSSAPVRSSTAMSS